MAFAKRMQGVANKLLTKFDERRGDDRLAILKQGDSYFDETLGEEVIAPDVKYFMKGVERTVSSDMVNGTTIQSGDKMLTVSVDMVDEAGAKISYVPAVNDKVLIDSAQWSITDTPHADYTGAGLIVAYKIQVRK